MADALMLGQAQGLNRNLGELIAVLSGAFPLHTNTGSFTMAAAATKAVADTTIKAGSIVLPMPTNAAAATLMSGSHSLYISVRTPGVGFTVATADAGSAAGTETFDYIAVSTG